MRVCILPILVTIPAVMRQTIASYILGHLSGFSYRLRIREHVGKDVCHKTF